MKYELGILNSSFTVTGNTGDDHALDAEINPDPIEVDAEAPSSSPSGAAFDSDVQHSDNFRQEVDTDLSFNFGAVSLGLHFVLKGDAPKFKICVTWARYVRDKEFGSNPRMFKRRPNFFVTGWIGADADYDGEKLQNGINGSVVTHPGAHLHVLKRRIEGSDKLVVKVFLENRTTYDGRQKEEHRIFQPQIRVVSDGKSELLDLDSEHGQDNDLEYQAEDLLYRGSRAKAKGYMCAAAWHEVDPEAEPDGGIGGMSWPDSQSVPEVVRDEFTRPLARTEYMPLYVVLQPDQSEKLEFDASEMSGAWDPEDIERKLSPIESKFSEWIECRKRDLDGRGFDSRLRPFGEKNLQDCEETRLRIRRGIDFLKTSERARASFCFMNAVMNDKRLNEKRENLYWREFQMAFILQSLRGASGDSEDERMLADVLWFPTGGGKTEAYLGIVIFTIAYRRLTPGGTQSNDGGVSVISRYTLRLLTIQQFQRALGAIVAADVRRVENWLPAGALKGDNKISDDYMIERLNANSLWGDHRFSLGLWIGTESTPKDFAHRTINHGKVLLNCEGALLPQWSREVENASATRAEPAQIQTCPVCGNVLCLPRNKKFGEPKKMTWVIRSPKPAEELKIMQKASLEGRQVAVNGDPDVELLGSSPDGMNFYRLTLEIKPMLKSQPLDRKSVDSWWKDVVRPKLADSDYRDPLESTSPSLPGYFFLKSSGSSRPHDFAIFCTDRECKLNKTKWFEKIEGSHDALIPEAFQAGDGSSKSVPISAYTIDEQIYLKCPSMLIATVDKFANLPFEPKCASIFGNVDVVHRKYGYGRRGTLESPLQARGKRERVKPEDLRDVAGFSPPSLILQDELHLIEGPLGSMVGVYEMAVDVLSDNGFKPKYIASSATIKEAGSQVGTIFRRGMATFPPPGIDSSDNYFSKIDEDIPCTKESPGRLYLGIATTKSTVTLPIKAQSIVMSEIFKIRSNPAKYGLAGEGGALDAEIDPYWTFVSYFSELRLLSQFTNFYVENIADNVSKWSVERAYNSESRAPNSKMDPGLRLFALRAVRDMEVHSISVYCANGEGEITLAIYRDGDPVGRLELELERQQCTAGENVFGIRPESPLCISVGERIWVAVINYHSGTAFQTVVPMEGSWEIRGANAGPPDGFPDPCNGTIPYNGGAARISLNSQPRQLEPDGGIVLSSSTTSEDLPKNLERLQNRFEVDSLQTSPIFGTGIDIDRLGIMQVMNQPKTNSGYIQSTGRVGRTKPGLVINWLRAGRARDLNHYENFIGYHMSLTRFVEPVTASPFSPRAMDRCLGPILVSILRNARSVRGVKIDPGWAGPNGPSKMAKNHDAEGVRKIGDALGDIAGSNFIAEFRKIYPEEFKRLFDESKARWGRLARDMEPKKSELEYAERNPNKLPSKNVVLGSPSHKDLGLDYAYENVPISLRETEPETTFYNADDLVPIRPSQFITKYGPGALIQRKTTAWVVPSVETLINCLQYQNAFEHGADMAKGLDRYAITDSRMKRILRRYHPDTPWGNLKLFALPSNASLGMVARDKVYRCEILSRWVLCYDSMHSSMVLIESSWADGKLVAKCPECQRVSGEYSSNFYGVRYVMACKKGHLGDVDWRREVHRNVGRETGNPCEGNVFGWKATGANDDVTISCMGHWKGDKFIDSQCGGTVTHIELKTRSKKGAMKCSARLAEGGDSKWCGEENDKSLAKMVSKAQMSLRMPIVVTTMEIQPYKGILFEYYAELAGYIVTFAKYNPGFGKEGFVQYLKEQQADNVTGFTDKLIRQTSDASERDIRDAIDECKKITTSNSPGHALTERLALEEELSSLVNQTRDHGTGVNLASGNSPDVRFPRQFHVMGINFEAMPFGDIKVTQVQTGYTREIIPPAAQDAHGKQNDELRIGEPVRRTARFTDNRKNTWYVANQLMGEGIFIHLDPKKHEDGADVIGKKFKSAQTWSGIHKKTRVKNEDKRKSLEGEKNSEQKIDDLEMETTLTNPLFVWWHSFVHELINQLARDSGFMGPSLGERVYCVTKNSGIHDAGVLIYAASPGADGTLGGLINLVDDAVLPKIIEKTLRKIRSCSNDPLCRKREINNDRRTGAACHACLMNSETSCAYHNKFLDRNIVSEMRDV